MFPYKELNEFLYPLGSFFLRVVEVDSFVENVFRKMIAENPTFYALYEGA